MAEDSTDQRMSTQESRLASIVTSVESLISSFGTDRVQRSDHERSNKEEMRILAKAVSDLNRFPVAPVMTGIGIMAVMVGGFYALLSASDTRIEESIRTSMLRGEERSIEANELIRSRVSSLKSDAAIHFSDGHPNVQNEAVSGLRDKITKQGEFIIKRIDKLEAKVDLVCKG